MSNESGNSSGVSSDRTRGRVVGKRFWCGELTIPLTSKSTTNPYRRYIRCDVAVERKKIDHFFTLIFSSSHIHFSGCVKTPWEASG
ncbi:unnamed protein product [Eruca vesicaria subsp. sativa]|uniref:Uncharacterized protein n=1 Tax=Eruca vesicaria subsp. sativa TaxID=29727 RepID=A0ABC8KT16_ERUVS|nr:unnamed protein product [Eruca vesicaria subsp. sativa]